MAQPTITRVELVDALHRCEAGRSQDLSRSECAAFLNSLLELVSTSLERGETVKLSGFGNFVVRWKKPRIGRNPKTGEEAAITPRSVVTFRPSQKLRDRVELGPRR